MANLIEVTEGTFSETVLKNTQPVVVDFWATWCPPCRILGPIIDQLADDYAGKITVCKVDVDSNQGLAQKYGIRSIPTVLFFKGGEVADQVIGAMPREQLKPKFEALL